LWAGGLGQVRMWLGVRGWEVGGWGIGWVMGTGGWVFGLGVGAERKD
jgi:hypothetical protein